MKMRSVCEDRAKKEKGCGKVKGSDDPALDRQAASSFGTHAGLGDWSAVPLVSCLCPDLCIWRSCRHPKSMYMITSSLRACT